MNSALARLLTRLYPRAWRERYGAEFAAFLEQGRGGVRALANVIRAALWERMFPTRATNVDSHTCAHSLRLHTWCARAPWAMFGFAPLLLLAVAYFVACFYLWLGWNIFLPGADTPFGHPNRGPIYAFQNIYFQAGKFYYFGAPILVGWGIGVMAVRQRVKTVWPIAGLILIALMGGSAQIQASRTAVPSGLGHIRMSFTPGPLIQGAYDGLFYALLILSLTVLPYVIWRRLQKLRAVSV